MRWLYDDGECRPTKTGCDVALFFDDERYRHVVRIQDQFERSKRHRQHIEPFAGHCSYADITIPIIVKTEGAAFEFDDLPQHSSTGFELKEFEQCLAVILGRQHRTHVLSLYVYRHSARMIYVDRDTYAVSHAFSYNIRDNSFLQQFFWRVARMTRSQLGYDPTVSPATQEDFKDMLEFARTAGDCTPYTRIELYYALCLPYETTHQRENGDNIPHLTSCQWPLQRVTRSDGSHILVGRPQSAEYCLFGQGIRQYVAYDPKNRTVFLMSDYWPRNHPERVPEHKIYARLASSNVSNVPTCLGSENVGSINGSDETWQTTATTKLFNRQAFAMAKRSEKVATEEQPKKHARVHYRIFFREILRPLSDFDSWEELVTVLSDALRGEGC